MGTGPKTRTNATEMATILESFSYGYQREDFVKAILPLLANAVDPNTFYRAVVEATYFRE